MKRKHLKILAEVIKDYHNQSMTIDEQIKRIEIAKAEGANIMVGHTAVSKALELLMEEMGPYLGHHKLCSLNIFKDSPTATCTCKLNEILDNS